MRLAHILAKPCATALGVAKDATPWVWPPAVIVLCAACGVLWGETARVITLIGVLLVVGSVYAIRRIERRRRAIRTSAGKMS